VYPQNTSLRNVLIDSVKVLCPTHHKIGHFGDVLSSQSLGFVLKTNEIAKANMHP